MSWNANIQSVLADRVELELDDLCREFGLRPEHDRETLRESLTVFAEEYEISIGVLRPGDALALFTEPPRTKNPIRWFFNRAAVEDKASELSFRLKQQRKELGSRPVPERRPLTIRDYVLAWSGAE